MNDPIRYEIIRHEDGWAYKVGDVFSETFRTHDEAREAAKRAAAEQEVSGSTEYIEYQDEKGQWHQERADGHDRPDTDVEG
jgi:hypothetical protein